jgi:hypothetical protein
MAIAVGFDGDQDFALRADSFANAFDIETDVVEMDAGMGLVEHGELQNVSRAGFEGRLFGRILSR